MKKPLLECAMTYKKIVCQIVSDIAKKKKKRLKNSDIKTFERPKNIKELDDSLLRNY